MVPSAAGATLFFVTPQYGRGKGGLGVSAERIAAHLAERFCVHVFELSDELPALCYEEQRDERVRRTRISALGEKRLVHQLVSDCLLAEAARTTPALLAGFYAAELSYPLMLTARLLSRDYLLFARGNDIDLDPFGDAGPRILTALEHALRVFCVSRELAHKIARWVPSARTLYVPNGVDPAEFACAPRRDVDARVRVGIFGDLKTKKGLPLLLAVMDSGAYALHIVGTLRSDGEKLLHGYATLYPERAEHIRHVSFVESSAALREQYAAVDVVCLPSAHEGMSNVMLEAMSSGRLCVASRVGGAIDVIDDGVNGLLFDAGDEASLRGVLERAALVVRGADDALVRAARARIVERFSASRERAAYLEALTSLTT